MHSTDVEANGKSHEVLFCLCFGTDKLRDWTTIKRTAANQGLNYMDPLHGFTNNIKRKRVTLIGLRRPKNWDFIIYG